MKIVLITGASSGLGAEFARQLDKEVSGIDEFWLVARRKERMEELAQNLTHPARIFANDVRNRSLYECLEWQLTEECADIKILVNNAGCGFNGFVTEQSSEKLIDVLDINCTAMTAITTLCIPFMKKGARIIHMASSAAYLPQPGFAAYAASKSYVLNFSRALGEELRSRGIYVTAVCPGPVDTPFFERAETNGQTLALKKNFSVSPEWVVRDALTAAKKRKTVAVCSVPMKLFRILCKIVPHSWILEFVENYDKESAEKDGNE